jgi:hypothetical protein
VRADFRPISAQSVTIVGVPPSSRDNARSVYTQVPERRKAGERVVDLRASAAINDAPSAFPYFAIFRVTRTSFQRIAEGISFSKAVASFQRHVKGMATTAPAVARKCATGSPSMPATRPHAALPTVIAPKKTVKNIASPRARTQSGKAIWAAA